MRIIFVLGPFLLLACRSTQPNCNSYKEGARYFAKHHHGDYMDNGSRDTTIMLLQQAINDGCKSYDLYNMLFYCYEWNRDYVNAEKSISAAIKIKRKKNPELYYWRGNLNMNLKRFHQSKADYIYYLRLSDIKYKKEGYNRLGLVYYVLGDSASSEKYRKIFVSLNGNRPGRDYAEIAKSWGLLK